MTPTSPSPSGSSAALSHVGNQLLGESLVLLRVRCEGQPQQVRAIEQPEGDDVDGIDLERVWGPAHGVGMPRTRTVVQPTFLEWAHDQPCSELRAAA